MLCTSIRRPRLQLPSSALFVAKQNISIIIVIVNITVTKSCAPSFEFEVRHNFHSFIIASGFSGVFYSRRHLLLVLGPPFVMHQFREFHGSMRPRIRNFCSDLRSEKSFAVTCANDIFHGGMGTVAASTETRFANALSSGRR